MKHPMCYRCQDYDIECWYCWKKGCHVEPESCCDEFEGYSEGNNNDGHVQTQDAR